MPVSIPPEFKQDWRQAQESEQCYQQTEQIEVLDAIVQAWERILAHPSFDGASASFQLAVINNAGNVLLRRYGRGDQLDDLQRALRLLRQAVQLTAPDSSDLPTRLNALGDGLRYHYNRTRALEDLEESIRVFQQVFMLTPPDSPDLPACLNNLGTGLHARYTRTGALVDLEESIRILEQAVLLTSPASPELPRYLNNLGIGLWIHYRRTGALNHLEEAIHILEQAVVLAPPDPIYLNNLGTGLWTRYNCTMALADLEKAIRSWQQAVQHTPPESPDRLSHLKNLGYGLRAHYSRTGVLADLEEAIRVYQQAILLTPQDSPSRPGILNNLGNSLSDRYSCTGVLADLEDAVRSWQQAVLLSPPDSPEWPGFLTNLGTGFWMLYCRTGALADLEEAIGVSQQAVLLTPPNSPEFPRNLNNLGIGLCDRYHRTGALADLEEAIRVYQQAILQPPLDSPDRPGFLNNLGAGLWTRYNRTGVPEDLEEAIRLWQQAVLLTPSGSPELPRNLNNLGAGLWARYNRTGTLADLEEAIRASQQAVLLTPSDSPELPRNLNNLGNGLRDRYNRTGALADLEEAIACCRQACELGSLVSQEVTLASSRAWGDWALERQAWEEACQAYAFGLEASQVLFETQSSRSAKESWLGSARGLASHAAFAFSKTNDLSRALATLEGGRARLLSEILEHNRRDLERLTDRGHADLLERYHTASQRIETLSRMASAESQPGLPAARLADWRKQMESAQIEIRAVIEQIRQVPGYETFLTSFTAELIQQQAQAAPLVYLTATSAGGLALIVTPENIHPLWLEGLTDSILTENMQGPADDPALGGYLGAYTTWLRILADRQATIPAKQAATRIWQSALDEIAAWLWQAAMEPIVASLKRLGSQHAILIPGGKLAPLPLHAAWREDPASVTGRHYALDEITFTYAPSARAVQEAVEVVARTGAASLLAVDNPDGSLAFSGEEVMAALAGFSLGTHLKGPQATCQAVLKALPEHTVLHFSTHGVAGWSEPLQSSLLLVDGSLTLGKLLDLRLPGARLAVLSACETGIPGAKLPDEVVSLPAVLMQAGVAGVAASLWSVADVSTAMLMTRFYELWRKDGLQPAEALRQAQFWLRDSTDGEKKAYFQSALPEFIGLRMPAESAEAFFKALVFNDPDAHSFAHPFYWAAFTYTGV